MSQKGHILQVSIIMLMMIQILSVAIPSTFAAPGNIDDDSYMDIEDDCHDNYGTSYMDRKGCPDSDGDGYSDPDSNWSIADGADAFKYTYWAWGDSDQDGTQDQSDYCPNTVDTNFSLDPMGDNYPAGGNGCDYNLGDYQYMPELNQNIQQSIAMTGLSSSSDNYSGEIFINQVSTLSQWWHAPIPTSSSSNFIVNFNISMSDIYPSEGNLPASVISVHTDMGFCGSVDISYDSWSYNSRYISIVCAVPITNGNVFIHYDIPSSTGHFKNLQYEISIFEEPNTQQNPDFIDIYGDGDLGSDSYGSMPVMLDEQSGSSSGFFNRTSYDSTDNLQFNSVRGKGIDNIQITSSNVLESVYGLENCEDVILNSGEIQVDCLVTNSNPSIVVGDSEVIGTAQTYVGSESANCDPDVITNFADETIEGVWAGPYLSWQNEYDYYLMNISSVLSSYDHYLMEIYLNGSMVVSNTFNTYWNGNISLDHNYSVTDYSGSDSIYYQIQNDPTACIPVEFILYRNNEDQGGMGGWNIDYQITYTHPVEHITEGDLSPYTQKFVETNETVEGRMGYNWDITDKYQIQIIPGQDIEVEITTTEQIVADFLITENLVTPSCTSSTQNGIVWSDNSAEFVLQPGTYKIQCSTNNTRDVIALNLYTIVSNSPVTFGIIPETVFYEIVVNTNEDITCCNDAGTGVDAPPHFADSGLLLTEGSYSASFNGYSDYSDTYTLEIPVNKSLITFLHGNANSHGNNLPYSDGDISYAVTHNNNEETMMATFAFTNPNLVDIEYPEYSSNDNCSDYMSALGYSEHLGYDWDGDGLSDYFEDYYISTSPYAWDSDGGGESDCWEFVFNRNYFDSDDDLIPSPLNFDINPIMPNSNYTISFYLVDSIQAQNSVISNIPSYLTIGNEFEIEFDQTEYINPLDDWRLDYNLINPDLEIEIPLYWNPQKSIHVEAVQESGQPLDISVKDGRNSVTMTIGEYNIVTRDLEPASLAANREYNSLILSGFDGSKVSVEITQISLSSTKESGFLNINSGIQTDGKLGIGTEGVDTSDTWNYTIPYGYFAVFDIDTDNDLAITSYFAYSDPGIRSQEISEKIIVCPNSNSNNSEYFGMLTINRVGGNGNYFINQNIYSDSCPLDYEAKILFDGGVIEENSNSALNYIPITSPGSSMIIKFDYQMFPLGATVSLEDLNGTTMSTIIHEANEPKDAYEYSPVAYPVKNDSEIVIVEFDDILISGDYLIKLKIDGVTISERLIQITEEPSWSINGVYVQDVISAFETPEWLVVGYDNWNGDSMPIGVNILETWMRGIDGYPINIGTNTQVSELIDAPTIMSESLTQEPRTGSLIHQSFTVDIGQSEIVELEKTTIVSSVHVSFSGPTNFQLDDLAPVEDVKYRINSELTIGGRTVSSVSGKLSLISNDTGELISENSFITNGLGEDYVIISLNNLYSGQYIIELSLDDEWVPHCVIANDIGLLIEENTNIVAGNDITEFDFNAQLRRSTLVGGDDITVDWDTEGQSLSSLTWVLSELDESGAQKIVSAGMKDSFSLTDNSGTLIIEIPNDMHQSNDHILSLVAGGLYGAIVNVDLYINGLDDSLDFVVSYSPQLPQPGDKITVQIDCDCAEDYLFWEWQLYSSSNVIDDGDGWVDSTKTSFTVDLPFTQMYNPYLRINIEDGDGFSITKTMDIEMGSMVEFEIDVPFYGNVGDTIEIEWEVKSAIITTSDEVVNIEAVMTTISSGEVLTRTVNLESGYNGVLILTIPDDLKPGTYVIQVQAELASGDTSGDVALIEIHDPPLGLSMMAMTPEVNRYIILFVVLNVIAIWTIIYRSKKGGINENDEETDTYDEDESKMLEGDSPDYMLSEYSYVETEISEAPSNDDVFSEIFTESVSNEVPSSDLVGTLDPNTNFEWIEFPAGSQNNWYRSDSGNWVLFEN